MRARLLICLSAIVLTATSGVFGQSGAPAAPQSRPMFRSGQKLILVDVTVRDKQGKPIEGLTAADFEIQENGKTQEIDTFAFEKVAPSTRAIVNASTLVKAGEAKGAVPVTVGAKPTTSAASSAAPVADTAKIDAATTPLTSAEVAGHRVWILLFDTSSMQPEEVQKAADAAIKWSTEKMSTSDLVAVASISSTLRILTDFTNDKAKITDTLKGFAVTDSTAGGRGCEHDGVG
jgi:VWFA-related protein